MVWEQKINRRIGVVSPVHQSVLLKELSQKAKLPIYQSVYVPTLTSSHKLRVATASPNWEEQDEVARPWGDVQGTPHWKVPRGRPMTHCRVYVSQLTWEHLEITPDELDEVTFLSQGTTGDDGH